jgi:tRNA (guanine37-N1)-methyltransferase
VSTSSRLSQRVEVGFVSRPHGVRGELRIVLHNLESRSLIGAKTIWLDDTEHKVVGVRSTKDAWLVRLDGVTTREGAEALKGRHLHVSRASLGLRRGEFLLVDLVGCKVFLPDGQPWGEVVALETGPQDRLVIRDGAVERLLPAVPIFFVEIDADGGRLVVDPPEGLPEEPVGAPLVRFSLVTLFPEAFDSLLAASLLGKGRAAGLFSVDFANPRDFTHDRHRTVDDTPYGGGPGMVMKPEPLAAAIAHAGAGSAAPHRIFLSPGGAPLTQAKVRELAGREHLVLVCGRYEGIDERIAELCIDETISLGDFVMTGGEIAAMAIIDAVARFVPGVLGEATSTDDESFSAGLLEYPQYTRPPVFQDRPVPDVLLSGNHAAIRRWRRQQSLVRTAARRPDLFARHPLDRDDRALYPDADPAAVAGRTTLVLAHHPVLDAAGGVVTTGVTNLDLHDLARSAATFGLEGFHAVTPIALQRERIAGIAATWREELGRRSADHRSRAVAALETRASIAEVAAELEQRHGARPIRIATSAARSGGGPPRIGHADLLAAARAGAPRPLLLILGTGWGLAPEAIAECDWLLEPISGVPDFNHLSVRSAGACILDRLFGRREP